jgi:EAL domain-containing protein (putative c-di-GMP-specific phosphodiesterase class I)/CHASE2 domain-containing sensor protein
MHPLRHLVQRLLISRLRPFALATAALIGLFALLSGAGGALDRQLQEARFALRSHAATGDVQIVEIDARSLAEVARWPWPRSIHARVVDRLRAAGVRSIAFDVDFSAASLPAEDAAFAAALDRAGGSVILSTFRQAAGGISSDYIDSVPIKVLAEKAFLASVNVRPDPDGYLRRMPLGLETTGTPRPSLPSMSAEAVAEIGKSFEIDYAIEPASVPRYSLVDVIEGRVPNSALAGKRIIIGATAIEMGDRYSVPRHGVIPGVVIQALAVETLLQGPVPQSWSGVLPLALVLIVTALAVRRRLKPGHLWVLAGALLPILALPLVTEHFFAISMSLAPALFAAAAAFALAQASLLARRRLHRALTDSATGLPNLAALEAAVATRESVSVVVVQLDHFAVIASGLGAEASAKLVLRVAERLKLGCGQDQVYRTDTASLAWVEAEEDECSLDGRLEAISALMRSPIECGRLIDVSLSFGLSVGAGAEARQLVANAALAALHASQRGTRWQKFSEADSEEADRQLSLLAELDGAMAAGDLWNAYQPKLDVLTGTIIGVETLARWDHRERGPIGPDQFIPLIEDQGRADDLTRYVLRQALADAHSWQEQGFPISVAVNVSATLLADHAFIESVRETLQCSRVPAERITIEVTESAAMHEPERAIAALESWRALGVSISIDDYGTGQSSLNYLQKLPATELKIDKSFVQTIESDRRNAIMVRSTIALAHELGMKVVAEGIEDEACLRLLGEMGCDTAQGYHIAKPMTADDLSSFLKQEARKAA